ncbi:MAG TPA: hypothetical protein EYP19_14630 [Desulfobacterales bacterium]|nr:hypothetical protein [Desulfobacterales bacterium]
MDYLLLLREKAELALAARREKLIRSRTPKNFGEVVQKLEKSLTEIRANFTNVQRREFAFFDFKIAAMVLLWDTRRSRSDHYRQLAMFFWLALWKMDYSLRLEEQHLDAFESMLTCLRQEVVSVGDVAKCRQALSRSGIEAPHSFGEKTTELPQLYEPEEIVETPTVPYSRPGSD